MSLNEYCSMWQTEFGIILYPEYNLDLRKMLSRLPLVRHYPFYEESFS